MLKFERYEQKKKQTALKLPKTGHKVDVRIPQNNSTTQKNLKNTF
jgi:hypothetical protein